MSDRVSSFKCAGTFVLRDLEENKNARLLNERKRRQGQYIVIPHIIILDEKKNVSIELIMFVRKKGKSQTKQRRY